MKNTFYVLLLIVIAMACGKKGDTVEPEAGARVAGTYELASITQSAGNQTIIETYPYSLTSSGVVITRSAQFTAVRQTETSVNVTFVQKETGRADVLGSYGTLDIRDNDLYRGADKFGTADGTTMTIEYMDQGYRTVLTTRKR